MIIDGDPDHAPAVLRSDLITVSELGRLIECGRLISLGHDRLEKGAEVMVRQYAAAALVVLVFAGTTGCSDSTSPERASGVVLTLDTDVEILDGQESTVAVIGVENLGPDRISYAAGCGYLLGVAIEDADGNSLSLWDPTLDAICPPVFHTLSPGASIQERWSLAWAWDDEGNRYRIPPGPYTLRTAFDYYVGEVDKRHELTKSLAIDLE